VAKRRKERLVVVDWLDASVDPDWGRKQTASLVLCRTVGWLTAVSKKRIVLIKQSNEVGQFGVLSAIPRAQIVAVHSAKVGKKISLD
jgi:hypothetical protein